jgi:hypothetical protein
VLYLKRLRAKIYGSDAVFGRFRYSDLKEAACVCGGRGLWELNQKSLRRRELHEKLYY